MGRTVPTYGRPLIVSLDAPVFCELLGAPAWLPAGRYRARTYFGRTERTGTAGGGPVFADVYLVPMEREGVGVYRLSLPALRELLESPSASTRGDS